MSTITAFQALRPDAKLAERVASKPYDVLNSQEAREEAADNPYSFLHITKAEIDLPPNVDTHSQQVYDKAGENLRQFIDKGVLDDRSIYPDAAMMDRLYTVSARDQKSQRFVNRLWTKIKTGR